MPIPVRCANALITKPFNTDHDFTASFTYVLEQSAGEPIDMNGFCLFFTDTGTLQGGGAGPGLGAVTDTTFTSFSAVSGLFMTLGFDISGNFTQSGALPQFSTGELSPLPNAITLRTTDFQYITSIVPTYNFAEYNKEHLVRIRLRKQCTHLYVDFFENGSYTNYYSYQTQLSGKPYSAYFGIGFSGDALFYIKNPTLSYYPAS